jgi:hypothetical protein
MYPNERLLNRRYHTKYKERETKDARGKLPLKREETLLPQRRRNKRRNKRRKRRRKNRRRRRKRNIERRRDGRRKDRRKRKEGQI